MAENPVTIALSPQHRLYLEGAAVGGQYPGLSLAFQKGSGKGLLYLDSATDPLTEEPAFSYWKDFARLYLSLFAATPGLESRDLKTAPIEVSLGNDDLDRFLLTAPPMKGNEYVTQESLRRIWHVAWPRLLSLG